MSQFLDFKAVIKAAKLNPMQKMGLNSRFKNREFPAPSEQDSIYEVTFGQLTIHVRGAEGGLTPDEMDTVADLLQRTRKNEQKAMMDMLTIITILPLGTNTIVILLDEWKQNGVESKLISGIDLQAQASEEVTS
jgi:hypothetical protein